MPVPFTQPPTTSSCSGRILTFCHAIDRAPGTYGERRSLAMIPSRPRVSGRLEERDPVGLDVLAQADARIRAEDAGEESPPLLERLVEERSAVEVEQVEDLVDERGRLDGALPCP